MHIRDPPLEGTLEWQKPAPHNFIYCACSSVKREPRCYIRAPPSVAIFQQVVGNVYAFLCIRITRLISFGVCAGFFRFAVHGGEVILLLNHENYNHYGFHDGYDG